MDITDADQDSDSIYTTNQTDIVRYAKHCYSHYPTIVNNIPKQNKKYKLSMDSYCDIDVSLAEAQLAIGESSNLAQLCLSYTYNFDDQKYIDYVCILSVLAQISIDSAKRMFAVDISSEIERIKKDINIKKNGYPVFWLIIKRGFNPRSINQKLKCPMNSLYNLKIPKFRSPDSTLPMDYFFQKFAADKPRKVCRRVEELINRYSFDLYNYNSLEEHDENYLLLMTNFDKLIQDIRSVYISSSYVGLFSWLIDRAFTITPESHKNVGTIKSVINKNKSLLLKTLYEVNADNLIRCFSKNLYS